METITIRQSSFIKVILLQNIESKTETVYGNWRKCVYLKFKKMYCTINETSDTFVLNIENEVIWNILIKIMCNILFQMQITFIKNKIV